MSCGCETYTCIEAWINPCSAGVSIPIESTVTNNITVMVEFNGMWTSASVLATLGQNIILPVTLFNEDYIHEMRLTMDEVETCYKVNARISLDSGEFIPTPPVSEQTESLTVTVEEISVDALTFTSTDITGTVVAIITDQQALNTAQFGQNGFNVVRLDGGQWYVGQTVTIFMIPNP